MVDIVRQFYILKERIMPSKGLTDVEGQKVVDEHYKTLAKTDIVEVDEINRRETICNTCDNKAQHFALDVCKSCYCFIKLKTALKGATCPLDKW
jgi:hypothetical protein